MPTYLDHAATTALRPEARDAWLAAAEATGNASSVHAAGRAARRIWEDARDAVAQALGCEPIEVVFTSGGTESVNLALKGLWWARGGALVLPDGEHHATLETAEWLETQGATIRRVGLDSTGAIPVEGFAAALVGDAGPGAGVSGAGASGSGVTDAAGTGVSHASGAGVSGASGTDVSGAGGPGVSRTAGRGAGGGVRGSEGRTKAGLATAMVANNEVGTVNDAAALARASAEERVPLHLDAVGAVGHVPVHYAAWRGDAQGGTGLVALSVSGHKIGAPIGTGALVVSRHVEPIALVHGGGQQRALRSGTPDVAGAAALATALRLATAERESEAARLVALRTRLIDGVRATVEGAELLGDAARRLPGNVHVLLPGARGETLLFLLDAAGISASTGSACQAGIAEPSHVVMALGRSEAEARSVLRFTLGQTSVEADVDALLAALPGAVARARAAR